MVLVDAGIILLFFLCFCTMHRQKSWRHVNKALIFFPETDWAFYTFMYADEVLSNAIVLLLQHNDTVIIYKDLRKKSE